MNVLCWKCGEEAPEGMMQHANCLRPRRPEWSAEAVRAFAKAAVHLQGDGQQATLNVRAELDAALAIDGAEQAAAFQLLLLLTIAEKWRRSGLAIQLRAAEGHLVQLEPNQELLRVLMAGPPGLSMEDLGMIPPEEKLAPSSIVIAGS